MGGTQQLTYKPGDTVVRLPGMPPMYDYEHWPQDVSDYEDTI